MLHTENVSSVFSVKNVKVIPTQYSSEVAVVFEIVWYLGLQLPMQSVPFTTTVVSSNPLMVRCTRYNII